MNPCNYILNTSAYFVLNIPSDFPSSKSRRCKDLLMDYRSISISAGYGDERDPSPLVLADILNVEIKDSYDLYVKTHTYIYRVAIDIDENPRTTRQTLKLLN